MYRRVPWRWPIPRSYLSTVAEVLPGGSTASGENAEVANTVTRTALQDTQHRIVSATILVRNPLILRPLSDFELAYEDYRQALQAERSRGTFDIMTAQRRELEELRGSAGASTDAGEVAKAGDGTNRSERSMLSEDGLMPPYKEANLDPTSLMRHLERKLYFVVQNERDQWRFPSTYVPTADTALHKVSDLVLIAVSLITFAAGRSHDEEAPWGGG